MNKLFFLDQDSACHWYLVDASKRAEWEAWVDLDEEDENSWEAPEFAKEIDNPWKIEFYLPD